MDPVIVPIGNALGEYVFQCPGCDSWHLITLDPSAPGQHWTLTGGPFRPTIRPAVLVNAENRLSVHRCHSFVTDGQIQFLPDCTHALAGRTVPLPRAL